MSKTIAAYVHFPWCVRKCPYCDFNSHPLSGPLLEQGYVAALQQDLSQQRQLLSERQVETVFYGGGTPSLFGAATFHQLNQALGCTKEVTMEANPGTTEHANFRQYFEAGINRLSLGAQSFNDDHLAVLGRIHKASDTIDAFESARLGGFDNINIDLMYALPRQSVEQAISDLRQAIELSPEHISWYQLTLEPKTEFYKRPPPLPNDDLIADIEAAGRALLQDNGYVRYEVSAWAKPGRQCQHNLNYWRFGDYIGVGAGAHGKLGAVRTEKAKQPRLYLAEPTKTSTRTLVQEDLQFEYLLNVLRLVDGVTWRDFEATVGSPSTQVAEAWQVGVDQQLLQVDRVATTSLGFAHLDGVLARFLPDG